MKLWGVAMVRNEADIVEPFVRHALAHLDGLTVADHASTDATPQILASLRSERLPLILKTTDHAGYLQSEITTALAREAFTLDRADAVFPLDADEFLRVPSRARLEDALRAVPPGHLGLAAWPTFAPPFGDGADIVAQLRDARRMRERAQRGPKGKVVLGAAFVVAPAATLVMGNHNVILGSNTKTAATIPTVGLDPAVVEVCHVPIRSTPQYVTKSVVMHYARLAANRDAGEGSLRREALDAIRRGDPVTPAAMLAPYLDSDDAEIAAALAAPFDERDRFLGDLPLRYTAPVAADPFPVVLSAAHHLVRRLVAARRRGAPRATTR